MFEFWYMLCVCLLLARSGVGEDELTTIAVSVVVVIGGLSLDSSRTRT